MSYITPRVLIQQEFTQLPVYSEFPLPAFIIGPNYALTRYSEVDEKPFTALGTIDGTSIPVGNKYNPLENTIYDFPNVPAGGDVDHSYTKVYAEAVESQYFPLEDLGLTSYNNVNLIDAPSGNPFPDKVRLNELTLKTANGYSRSSCFSNRDVAVGDVIEITDNLDNVVKAKIKALYADTAVEDEDLAATVGEQVASGTLGMTEEDSNTFTVDEDDDVDFTQLDVVGKYISIKHAEEGSPTVYKILAVAGALALKLDKTIGRDSSGREWFIGGTRNDENNVPWTSEVTKNGQLATYTGTNVGGAPSVTAAIVNATYRGYAAKRVLRDTYTVTVTTPGTHVNGATDSAVRFSVSSLNGAFTKRTNLSITSGDVLVVDSENYNNITLDFTKVGDSTFALGDSWSIGEVIAPVEPIYSNLQTTGEFTGPVDMVYTIRVERGGAFYDEGNATTCARLVISSSDIDTSKVVLPIEDTYFNVGSFGVQAQFTSAVNNGGLIAGDVYYIPVTAEKAGAVRIVEIDETLSEATLSLATTITAKLFLTQKAIQIPEVRDILTDSRNWSQEESYITINTGITSYDSNLISAGVPVRLPVTTANLFVEHRDLLQDYVTAIDSVRSLADVHTKLGTIHPDNPLAQGVYDAVLNSQNQLVYFVGVATNDLNGYIGAIKISEKNDKVYSFVPLTFDRVIQDAVVSHVNAYSTPEVGRWRIAWLSVEDQKTRLIYDLKEDGAAYTATVTDDPAVSGTQYKLVTVAGAKFVDDGVRPNDTIRLNFRLNADGKMIYDEYVVDKVRTNTSLVLTRPLPTPINSATKVQVVRNYTKSERAYNIGKVGGDYNNRRVRVVFPDTYKYGNVVKQGYFAAAGLAGLRAGVVPHQGLTNSEFLGATDLSKVVLEFTQDDLNTMAEQGIWLITQEVIGATPYVRHQITTDERSLNTSEDSITTNVDNISYALKKTLAPFIGRFNINTQNLVVVGSAIAAELTFRANSTYTYRAGNQLVSFNEKTDIIRLEQNSTYKDRIDVEVRLHVPYPMNYISLKLIAGE